MIQLSYENAFDESEEGGYTDGLAQFTDVVSDWMRHMPVVDINHSMFDRITNTNARFIYHAMFIARSVRNEEDLFKDEIFEQHLKWYQDDLDEIRQIISEGL